MNSEFIAAWCYGNGTNKPIILPASDHAEAEQYADCVRSTGKAAWTGKIMLLAGATEHMHWTEAQRRALAMVANAVLVALPEVSIERQLSYLMSVAARNRKAAG